MNALTLKHPWALAIRDWGKRVENRTWAPPRHLIGKWLAIHGGADPKGRARIEALNDLRSLIQRGLAPQVSLADAIVPGIVCVVRLARVVRVGDDDPIVESPWFHGPYGWVFDKVEPLPKPIRCPGKQGLWPLPKDVHVALMLHCRKHWDPIRREQAPHG